ncbi:MFS transporter (plasmid) [Rhizobium leguminosarum]|uniref:MFS transporter n=1 Tax=Rhizobium leguminosarum TaxID=384 RepID=UPI00103DE056|nr:MFS transporter [Rhizobium leguminosarum]MBY5470573.1 MFS transporter [Rhizobium leguminosarum]TBZ46626.1 MFS transporter [Rhizobium leguminosarum bv. viciae]TBZ66068.1 MFS transporter [Rhizobium leguminosarum bv. viciae]TBZ83228.1 MFS transporter [Rhizobium leguminosarum bv. viciae]TCA19301.1 MFS transporter [Rhizobium leguminosarum bv. viciae]
MILSSTSSSVSLSEDADSPTGWRVVGGAHALTAVTFGSAYAFSAVFPGLSEEFAASRGEIALVFSISAFVFYSLGAIAGPLADRWSSRAVIAAGLVAMIAGYVGASQAKSLGSLYVWYGAGVGLGIGLSYVPALGAVQSWFVLKRSRASGIATAGLGLGTLLLPFTIGRLVPGLGWRGCFISLAVVIAVIGLPAAMLVRKRPDANSPSEPRSDSPPGPFTVWRDSRFRLFFSMLVLASFCTFIPYVHIVPAAHDIGLSLESGTILIALIGIGNIFGRFVLAGLGDRIGSLRLLAILTFAVACTFLLWSVANGMVMLVLFALLFGMSYGGCVGLYPAVAADLFGTRHIGTILGYLYTAVGIAALLGPTMAGLVFDKTGSYLGPILFSMVAALAASFLTLRLR